MSNFKVSNVDGFDIKMITFKRHSDSRGYFSEIYRDDIFSLNGFIEEFVQENLAFSEKAGTLRGLHFQSPPHAQGKLIQVKKGKIFDVAVDVRTNSQTFGKVFSVILSDVDNFHLYIPEGYAHGYLTLEDKTEVMYKTTNYYQKENEGGILWSDEALGIKWPLASYDLSISEKDNVLPLLSDLKSPF